MNKSSIKGNALLVALLIMSLIATLATAMHMQTKRSIYRTQLYIDTDKMLLAANDALVLALQTLKLSPKEQNIKLPKWYMKQNNGFQVETKIIDLQKYLNLNNLDDLNFQKIFARLLNNIHDKKINGSKAFALIRSIRIWINNYDPNQKYNLKEHNYYLSIKPPYYPAYQPLQDKSELLLLLNFSNYIYFNIINLITTIPEKTLININTADLQIIKAISPKVKNTEIEAIMAKRQNKQIFTAKDIKKFNTNWDLKTEVITYKSNYFLVLTTIKTKSRDFIMSSTIKLSSKKNTITKIETIKNIFYG